MFVWTRFISMELSILLNSLKKQSLVGIGLSMECSHWQIWTFGSGGNTTGLIHDFYLRLENLHHCIFWIPPSHFALNQWVMAWWGMLVLMEELGVTVTSRRLLLVNSAKFSEGWISHLSAWFSLCHT
jgi:hypothetical protein